MSNQIIFIDRTQKVELINKNNRIEVVSDVVGLKGDTGSQGQVGADGKSAFQVWKEAQPNPNLVTIEDFLIYLQQGPVGPQGPQGIQGPQGERGLQGIQGIQGDSAYQVWLANGGAGSEIDFLESIVGLTGDSAYQSAVRLGFTGTEQQWITSLIGQQGIQGPQGERGLQGPTGQQGPQGERGLQGIQGPQGPQGLRGIQGEQGIKGDTGATGVGISSAYVSNGNLIITLTNTNQLNVGYVKGEAGKSVTTATINQVGELVLTLSDNSQINAGVVKGEKGATGSACVILGSVANPSLLPTTANIGDAYIVDSDGDLYVYNGSSFTSVGQIVGPQGPQGLTGPQGVKGDQGVQGVQGPTGATGPQGPQGFKGDKGDQGVGVFSTSMNGLGELIMTLTNGNQFNVGVVKGQDGNMFIDNSITNGVTDRTASQNAIYQALLGKASTTDLANKENSITKSVGYATWTGTTWSFKNESYSLSSHTHDYSSVYAPISHDHNATYYTQTQINNLINGYVPYANTNGIAIQGDLTIGDTVNPTGIKAYIKSGSSGRTWEPNQNLDLVIETPSIAGINIIGGNTNEQRIYFSDTDIEARGAIIYNHADDSLRFTTAGTTRFTINNLGQITSAPTYNNVSSQPSNVYIDSTGKLFRTTATGGGGGSSTALSESGSERIQSSFANPGIMMIYPQTVGGNSFSLFGLQTITHSGTAQARFITGTSLANSIPRVALITGTSTTSFAGSRLAQNERRYIISEHVGFFFKATFGRAGATSTQNLHENFFGITSQLGDTLIANVNIRTIADAFYGIGVEQNDTNLQFMYCLNATSGLVKVDLGAGFPKTCADDSEILELKIVGQKEGKREKGHRRGNGGSFRANQEINRTSIF